MMNSVQHPQSWRLKIQAKAKKFDFKLSAMSLFHHCNCSFFQFSVKLKLFRLFLIRLKCEPKISTPTDPRSSKSKLRRFLEKLRIRRRPNSVPKSCARRVCVIWRPNSVPKSCARREMSSGSSVAGLGRIVGLLGRPVFKKDKDGAFILGSTTLFCVTWLFKNLLRRNWWVFMVLLIAAVVGFSDIMDFGNHFNEDYVITKSFWKVKKLFVRKS